MVRMIPWWRTTGSVLVAAVVSALVVPAASNADEAVSTDDGPGCRFVNAPVPASVLDEQMVPAPGAVAGPLGGDAAGLDIHGRLCLPAGDKTPKTVMHALHGIVYNNAYWNVDYQPEICNFSRYMTGAGYAVFAIDRLGSGRSSKPPAALVTLDAQAAVHQLIGKLRSGEIDARKFERVMLVGYSYGSATSWRETFATFRPAQLDSRFRDRPPGYLTLGPGREDWPVMPVGCTGFILKPFGFFDQNPALNVPAPTSPSAERETSTAVYSPEPARRPPRVRP